VPLIVGKREKSVRACEEKINEHHDVNPPDIQNAVVSIFIVSVKEVRKNHDYDRVGNRRGVEPDLSFVVTHCLDHSVEQIVCQRCQRCQDKQQDVDAASVDGT
jgi:hypothetical protein